MLVGTPLSNPAISITYVTAPAADRRRSEGGRDRPSQPPQPRQRAGVGRRRGRGAKAIAAGGPPTITINVEGPWTKRKVQTAANSLAQSLIGFANRYTTLKASLIAQRIAIEKSQLRAFTEAEQQAHKNMASSTPRTPSPSTRSRPSRRS